MHTTPHASAHHARGDRTRLRRAAASIALVSIVALLALPALAFAAENLVTSSNVPVSWYVTFDDSGLYHVNGFYSRMGTAETEYGPSMQALWEGEGRVSATLSGGDTMFAEYQFSSFEDFQARSAESYSADVTYSWSGAQRTTIGGYEAYLNIGDYSGPAPGDPDSLRYDRAWVGWVPLASGGVSIVGNAWAQGDEAASGFDEVAADVSSVLGSLRFRDLGAAGPSAPGLPGLPGADEGGTSPWRTVAGGLGAVAAAAVALAGAMASARAKSGAEEPAPDQPVGHVLQLSTRSLTVSAEHSAAFTAQAFAVLPDGSYRPAPDAALILHPPAGVSVQPQTAYGTLSTVVWQTGALAPGATLTVEAQSALGTTTAAVGVAVPGESRIVTRIEPAGTLALRTQGGHSITLVAAVELLGADATDPAVDAAAVRASIAFAEDSEWLEISEPADYEDGRAITVMASQPDPTSPVQPPESATVRVTAQLGERVLNELVAIPLAGLPEIDATPDEVMFAAESGAAAEVAVTITNAGDTPWQFDTVWREGSRAIAAPSIEPTGPSSATLTLTESGGDGLDPTRPQTAATLVVVATADGFDELRRQVDVIVTQEGLFIDRTNVDPSTGAFPLAADGSARATAIDLRVFVRDPASGEIAPDIALAEQATLEIGGQEGTSGHAGLKAGGLTVEPAGVRQLNVPSATFNVSLERKLPTAGEPVPAALLASVPGYDADRFSALVPMRLLGVNMEPFSDAWEIERDNCLDMIRHFVPFEHQDRLYALVAERSLTMGAEGLFYMRKQIWSFAHDQIMIEKHEHLDAAWWNQQIEDTLDWVSWCGDIALGVASGAYLGVVGSIAIGMLKPLLVSAMEVWLAGGGLDDWLVAQTSTITGVLEGSLTDPDILTKLSGDKKAIGWALFIAYYFAKELYNDPNLSVTNAMKNVGRQLRDEGLVRFLQWAAGKRGITLDSLRAKGAAGTDGAAPKTAGGADAGAPTTPPAPGGPRARSAAAADAPRTRTPAGGDAPPPRTPAAGPDGSATDTGRARGAGDADTATRARTDGPDADAAPRDRTPDGETRPADAETRPRDADSADQTKKTAEADADARPEQAPEQKPTDRVAEKGPDTDPRTTHPDPAVRAKGISEDIAAKTSGGTPLDVPTVERIMRDPDAMRNLRKTDPEGWRKFNETRQKVYKAHDTELREWAKKNLPEGQDHEIAVHTVGHVDGVDRDYRLGYFKKDPSGHNRFIEIPREKWAPESRRIFSEKTGGPSDARGAERWATERQQLQTDYTHPEASIDMADQGTVYDPETGTWKETRLTPNDQLVKDGRSTLIDPEGYGETYRTKVMNSHTQGNTLDAFAQADKAAHSLDGVRKGYTKQGFRIDDLPPRVSEGMDIVRAAKDGTISASDANAQLARLGYTDGLPGLMDDIATQFGNLGSAQKP